MPRYGAGQRSPARLVAEREACYVGVKPCGCAVAAVVPRLEDLPALARRVAGWMKKGYAIEQHTVADARELLTRCPHQARPAPQLELGAVAGG